MTTEDLIELLRQHPKEQVCVAVRVGEQTAFCPLNGVLLGRGTQPRVTLLTELEIRLDEARIYDLMRDCVLPCGEFGERLR